jgi:hypothetical protein
MNDWFDKIHNAGFSVDTIFTMDGDKMIVLHYFDYRGFRKLRVFKGIDADNLMAEALQWAETYDAYVNTSCPCGVRH